MQCLVHTLALAVSLPSQWPCREGPGVSLMHPSVLLIKMNIPPIFHKGFSICQSGFDVVAKPLEQICSAKTSFFAI